MRAEILTIGDELLIGQIINTNQAYIAERLNSVGVSVEKMLTVGDDMSAIMQAFQECWDACQVVIVTGGLGPTHDDITKKAVCEFFHTGLISRQDLRERIQRLLARRGAALLATWRIWRDTLRFAGRAVVTAFSATSTTPAAKNITHPSQSPSVRTRPSLV